MTKLCKLAGLPDSEANLDLCAKEHFRKQKGRGEGLNSNELAALIWAKDSTLIVHASQDMSVKSLCLINLQR